ncbi:MAG TPA: hypothetical protein VFE13_14675 [Caulobacteraceae bacterium]|jgi:hypothetical protein|nr:hypothetical protein [Caulobacteraceae bacterium]
MTVWHASTKPARGEASHGYSAQEIAIFAAGLLIAVMVGIAASGALPIA